MIKAKSLLHPLVRALLLSLFFVVGGCKLKHAIYEKNVIQHSYAIPQKGQKPDSYKGMGRDD